MEKAFTVKNVLKTNLRTDKQTKKKKNELQRTLNLIPSNKIQIILGNFNTKIRKEAMFRSIAGNPSLHNETNDNNLN